MAISMIMALVVVAVAGLGRALGGQHAG
jgi:hypothetical protein